MIWSCSCRYRQLLIGLCLFLSVFPLVTHILLEFNHMRCGITTRGLHIIRHGEPVDGLEPGVVLEWVERHWRISSIKMLAQVPTAIRHPIAS